jgi:DNA polymerase-3 subunit alpha
MIIQKIKNINDEKENHQTNLFSDQENTEVGFNFEPSASWSIKELLSEEFKSIGFYLTNHPLNEFEEIFNQLNIMSYNQFYENE